MLKKLFWLFIFPNGGLLVGLIGYNLPELICMRIDCNVINSSLEQIDLYEICINICYIVSKFIPYFNICYFLSSFVTLGTDNFV